MRVLFLIILLFSSCFYIQAQASVSTRQNCNLVYLEKSNLDMLKKKYKMKLKVGEALRICKYFGSSYSEISHFGVIRKEGRICQFTTSIEYRNEADRKDKNNKLFEGSIKKLLAGKYQYLTTNACPDHASQKYIYTKEVKAENFIIISNAWREFSGSAKKFDQYFSAISSKSIKENFKSLMFRNSELPQLYSMISQRNEENAGYILKAYGKNKHIWFLEGNVKNHRFILKNLNVSWP